MNKWRVATYACWGMSALMLTLLGATCQRDLTPLPTTTPAPTATCAPTDCSALSTRVAQMEATVAVWETVMPDVMQTAAALYEWSLTPVPTCPATSCQPTPVLCARCQSDRDCPDGYVCKLCATCYLLCVRVISPNGDCNNCLLAGVK